MTRLAPQSETAEVDAGGVPPLLAAVDVVKSFGSTPALQGASLDLAAGEIVAVMGPSGSGKSTLLHCLAGIVQPDGGRVAYRGHDLARLSDRARSALRRSDFGFVFQFGQLVPELAAWRTSRCRSAWRACGGGSAEERARGWLERLEVADVAGQRQGDVSGGQAQRVAVARALVTDPRVVFADEPTGALDSLNGERVLLLLTDAARAAGVAIVLVTHEPRVAAYADREVVVRDGRTRTAERGVTSRLRELGLGARLALAGRPWGDAADGGSASRSASGSCCWRRRCRAALQHREDRAAARDYRVLRRRRPAGLAARRC